MLEFCCIQIEVDLLTLSQTTNFRIFQTERVSRQQLWTWWKWHNVFQTENTVEKGEIAHYKQFLAPLALGQQAYVMARCPLCVHSSVCASIRPCVNLFLNLFSEITYRILMKFCRIVPAMVLFRIFWNNLIPSKALVAMATKLKIFWNL